VAFAFKGLRHSAVERFYAIGLKGNKPVTVEMISMGTLNASLVHPRETLALLIDKGCDGAYFLHNHPSGAIEPSEADILLSYRLAEVGRDMGVAFKGHVIIDTDEFYNIGNGKEEGVRKHKKAAENPTDINVYEKYLKWVGDKPADVSISSAKQAFEVAKGIHYDKKRSGVVFYLDVRDRVLSYEVIPKAKLSFERIYGRAVKMPTGNIILANFSENEIESIDMGVVKDGHRFNPIRRQRGSIKEKV
jgi:DNA repair protein RadC